MQLDFFPVEVKKNRYDFICQELTNKKSLTPDEFGKEIRKWSSNKLGGKINTLGLFSGAGGLDIGFHDSGFDILETVELESKFVDTQLLNQSKGKYLQGTKIVCEDIQKYYPKFSNSIDFIIGGPPCQSFSSAGRRAAGVRGTKDSRGGLFWEYVRLLKELEPKGFLFENVYGLLGAEKGQAIKIIEKAFRDVGYILSYRILDAADYGVPQHRERLIIVGTKGEKFKFPRPTNGPDSEGSFPHLSAEKALKNVKSFSDIKEGINGRFGHLLNEVPPGLNYSYFTERMGHPEPIFAWRSKFSDFLYKADPEMPVRTLKASGGQYTGPFHWDNRKFTINELKRLQTFPDDYDIVGNYGVASKQIGNSVPPQFSRVLALSILNQVFNVELPFEINYLEENEPLSFRTEKSKRTKLYAEKAKEAIAKLEENNNFIQLQKRNYSVSIGSNFQLEEKDKGDYIINSKPSKTKWVLEVTENKSEKIKYEIVIKASKKEKLFKDIESISLKVSSPKMITYTTAWKTLERELSMAKIKADLVQLSGYYQYSSNLSFSIKFFDKNLLKKDEWKAIELILNDPEIGQIQSISRLSLRYEIEEKKLIHIFKNLRKLGFEIRSNNTNPEIEHNHYLIPYKFPTLTPQSVQLNKKL